MAKQNGKRYTEQERGRILAAAKQQGLNGVQAAKKFGISTLTYYTWKKKATTGSRARQTSSPDGLDGLLRTQVRDRIRELLPGIVKDEVASYVRQVLGSKV